MVTVTSLDDCGAAPCSTCTAVLNQSHGPEQGSAIARFGPRLTTVHRPGRWQHRALIHPPGDGPRWTNSPRWECDRRRGVVEQT
jgi:hypothetical protein